MIIIIIITTTVIHHHQVNHQHGSSLSSPGARQALSAAVLRLEERINAAVINRIIQVIIIIIIIIITIIIIIVIINNRTIQDMADISTPLKQFTDAVLAQEAMARKRELVEQKGAALKLFSSRLSRTANIVASANARTKRRSEGLVHLSSQVRYSRSLLLGFSHSFFSLSTSCDFCVSV